MTSALICCRNLKEKQTKKLEDDGIFIPISTLVVQQEDVGSVPMKLCSSTEISILVLYE